MLLNIGELSRIIGKFRRRDRQDDQTRRAGLFERRKRNAISNDPAAFREWMIARNTGLTNEELRASEQSKMRADRRAIQSAVRCVFGMTAGRAS